MVLKQLLPSQWLPVERRVAVTTGLIGLLMIGVLGLGDRIPPRVRSANWEGQRLGARDRVLVLTFSRLMDEESVEEGLHFDPPAPGRPRWAGRRLVYTLERPLRYGETYSLTLTDARDRQGRLLAEPYELELPTRDRQFLAIGTEGKGEGQLIHVNLTAGTANLVTPPELEVTELAVGGDGDTAYYFARDRDSPRQRLYQLSLSARQSTLLLDNDRYQNFRLRVSPDGTVAMVERIDDEQPSAPELWMRTAERDRFEPIDIGGETRGDFSIAPDNNSLIVAQGQGLAVVPLNDNSSTPDFLPQFGQVLAIAPDGSAAAAVQFNSDISQTLAVVTHTGQRHDLARASGSIQAGIFAPTGSRIYATIGTADPETFAERPQLVTYDWGDRTESALVSLSYPATLEFDLAPDETAILYSSRALDIQAADEVLANGDAAIEDDASVTIDDRIHLLELGDPAEGDGDRHLTLTSIAGRSVTWIP